MARGRSQLKGALALRRTLRALPDAVTTEVADELRYIGVRQLARARAEVPRQTGRLAGLLSFRVLAKSLILKLGLVTKAAQRRGFYGYILDAGRRAQIVTAKRRGKRYPMRIRAISPARYNFVFGRRRDIRETEIDNLRGALTRALRKVSSGGPARGD